METKYNYFQAMVQNIESYIADNGIKVTGLGAIDRSELYDKLFVTDSVTGNASGSYTFSTWRAAECVCHNEDLLLSALVGFGFENDVPVEKVCNPEWCDVIIRCYLLAPCLDAVIDGIKEDVADYYESHNMEE